MLNILSMALIPILVDFLDDPLIQLIVVSLTFGIGLLQGVILGRAILQRFPRLQNHVKTVSVTLFVLFLINAVLSVPRFQSPEKIDLTNLSVANPADVISSIFFNFWNEYWISYCSCYFNNGDDFCYFKIH